MSKIKASVDVHIDLEDELQDGEPTSSEYLSEEDQSVTEVVTAALALAGYGTDNPFIKDFKVSVHHYVHHDDEVPA